MLASSEVRISSIRELAEEDEDGSIDVHDDDEKLAGAADESDGSRDALEASTSQVELELSERPSDADTRALPSSKSVRFAGAAEREDVDAPPPSSSSACSTKGGLAQAQPMTAKSRRVDEQVGRSSGGTTVQVSANV